MRIFPNDECTLGGYVLPLPIYLLGAPAIPMQPMDDTSEKLKISDKDFKSNLAFADVVDKGSNALLPSKLDHMKATQKLVEKQILAPLTLVKDSGRGNPLRQKGKNKKKKRVHRELAKFDEEILNRIPPEKLAKLLEDQPEDGDSEVLAASLRDGIKKLVSEELQKDADFQQGGDFQKEVVVSTVPVVLSTN